MRLEMKKEIQKLFSSAKQISRIYHEDQTRQLPEPTRRYLKYALKEKQQYISFVHLRHGGQFKLSKKWASIKGEEYFTVNPLGFAWFGKVGFISAKDIYYEGFGRMQVKLLSIIKLVDAKGDKFNQGELVRWLSETPWFPTAMLPSKNLHWEPINNDRAKVFLTDHDITVEGTFFFNDEGQITKFITKRFGDGELQDWICQYHDYEEVEGMHIPFYGEASWNSESEDSKYAKFRIEKI
jgi:hypothetical protein